MGNTTSQQPQYHPPETADLFFPVSSSKSGISLDHSDYIDWDTYRPCNSPTSSEASSHSADLPNETDLPSEARTPLPNAQSPQPRHCRTVHGAWRPPTPPRPGRNSQRQRVANAFVTPRRSTEPMPDRAPPEECLVPDIRNGVLDASPVPSGPEKDCVDGASSTAGNVRLSEGSVARSPSNERGVSPWSWKSGKFWAWYRSFVCLSTRDSVACDGNDASIGDKATAWPNTESSPAAYSASQDVLLQGKPSAPSHSSRISGAVRVARDIAQVGKVKRPGSSGRIASKPSYLRAVVRCFREVPYIDGPSAPTGASATSNESTIPRDAVQVAIARWLTDNAEILINNTKAWKFTGAIEVQRYGLDATLLAGGRKQTLDLCQAVLEQAVVRDFPCFRNVSLSAFGVLVPLLRKLMSLQVPQAPGLSQYSPLCRIATPLNKGVGVKTDDATYLITFARDMQELFCSPSPLPGRERRYWPGEVDNAVVDDCLRFKMPLEDGVAYWEILSRASTYDRLRGAFARDVKRAVAAWREDMMIKRERVAAVGRAALALEPRLEGVRSELAGWNKHLAPKGVEFPDRLGEIMPDLVAVASVSKAVQSSAMLQDDKEFQTVRDAVVIDSGACHRFWNWRYLFSLDEDGVEGVALDTVTGVIENAHLRYVDILGGWECRLSRATTVRWNRFAGKDDQIDVGRFRPLKRHLLVRKEWRIPRGGILSFN